MNDQNYELEQNLPSRAKEIINKRRSQIEAARGRIELLAPRFELPAPVNPKIVQFDALAQVAQNELEAFRTLNSLSTERQSISDTEGSQPINDELNLDMIRKQIEAA